jgi:hypothetical protein
VINPLFAPSTSLLPVEEMLCSPSSNAGAREINSVKKVIFGAMLAAASTAASAQYLGTGSNPNSHSASGYARSNGTYVQPYQATNPNSTQRDNFGSTGNVNPYTGVTGHRTPRY